MQSWKSSLGKKCQELKCTLGDVMNLAPSGIRFVHKGRSFERRRNLIKVMVETGDREFVIYGRVVESRKLGFRTHALRVAPIEVTPELESQLFDLRARLMKQEKNTERLPFAWGMAA